MVCHPSNKRGIKAGELVVDFLGEMYPPWAWQAKQDAIKTVAHSRHEVRAAEFPTCNSSAPPGAA